METCYKVLRREVIQSIEIEEGKKIGWRDGVHAINCILKYNLLR